MLDHKCPVSFEEGPNRNWKKSESLPGNEAMSLISPTQKGLPLELQEDKNG